MSVLGLRGVVCCVLCVLCVAERKDGRVIEPVLLCLCDVVSNDLYGSCLLFITSFAACSYNLVLHNLRHLICCSVPFQLVSQTVGGHLRDDTWMCDVSRRKDRSRVACTDIHKSSMHLMSNAIVLATAGVQYYIVAAVGASV